MAIDIDTNFLVAGSGRMSELGSDVNRAITYTAEHLESFKTSEGGLILQNLLEGHSKNVGTIQDTFCDAKDLLVAASFALEDSARK